MSVISTYYTNGELKEEYFELNGKKEGNHKIYNDNGQLEEEVNYIDGLRQ